MPAASTIVIRYDGTDITDKVLFQSARFESQANAIPGSFSFIVKDIDQDQSFITGKEVTLTIDGVKLFGGIVMQVARLYALPVVDTSVVADVTARQWQITGVDYNLWFDKRVIRNPSDYRSAITLDGPQYDGWYIRNSLPDYIDVPPGVDMTTYVDDVATFGRKGTYTLNTQGTPWRRDMEDFAARSASVFYIDADKNLHFHALEDVIAPWKLVDHEPNGVTTIGCRDVSASEDGSMMVTDAFVWGGNEYYADSSEADPSGIFFTRFPTAPANDKYAEGIQTWTEEEEQRGLDRQTTYGIWQYGEQRFSENESQETIDLRAKSIVIGPPGTGNGVQRGLSYPTWSITATWFAHDVPSGQHLHPGDVVEIILYVMGTSSAPLFQVLPLRTMTITFPQIPADNQGATKSWVQFQGQFGLAHSDSRFLWRFLMQRRRQLVASVISTVSSTSTTSSYGSYGSFTPSETPNGATTTFTIPFPYVAGTLRVYLNGLLQRPGREYEESAPESGAFAFYTAPFSTDQVYVECRTGQGGV